MFHYVIVAPGIRVCDGYAVWRLCVAVGGCFISSCLNYLADRLRVGEEEGGELADAAPLLLYWCKTWHTSTSGNMTRHQRTSNTATLPRLHSAGAGDAAHQHI
ncbi:hypothetical protein E2C01_068183 [Portunus trituberculatus]|uniref:Uncharacterized protein n=1 Tax=Portunus trituberculatus TaxID=210409 RepID=A0A5B7HV39_PORTR|nr:hypothetical protein [Portunus trituberculatus]